MSWFPQDVDTNAGGKYLNIKKAPLGREVRFRILGDTINGYLAWGKKRDVQGAKDMPLRWRRGDKAPRGYVYQVDMQTGELRAPQQFVAFPVWDYAGKRVRVMELTQVTILKMLKAYADSPDWGSPTEYDMAVTRTEEGGKTSYAVQAKPKLPLADEAEAEWAAQKAAGFNLAALFDGKDPFPKEAVAGEAPDPFDDEPPFPSDDDIPF